MNNNLNSIKFFIIIILTLILLKNIIISKKNELIMNEMTLNNTINHQLISIPHNNDKLKKLEKSKLLEYISKAISKNITLVKYIFLKQKFRFGNQLILIYKTIFYCEILGCKKIILDKNENNWFINNKIIYKKYKMIIEINSQKIIKNYRYIIIDKTTNFFYYKYLLKCEFRINLLKKEILNNLPKVSINNKDLYIYIRSGDIFIKAHPKYIQPPLCFYSNILNNFEFRNIYIIAENKNNPIIGKLLESYSNIIYLVNPLRMDISFLVNAYNIVGGSISTFMSNILLLNNNLEFYWDFKKDNPPHDFSKKLKIKDFYKKNIINVFLMYASKKYIYEMIYWKNDKAQLDLMINDKCNNNFYLINRFKYK